MEDTAAPRIDLRIAKPLDLIDKLALPATREDQVAVAVAPSGKDVAARSIKARNRRRHPSQIGWQGPHRTKGRDAVVLDMDPGIINNRKTRKRRAAKRRGNSSMRTHKLADVVDQP